MKNEHFAFLNAKKETIAEFWQWDVGQKIVFQKYVPTGTEVQFDDGTVKVVASNAVQVPNALLEEAGKHTAYVQVIGSDHETTVYEIGFVVNARAKKDDYQTQDDAQTFREQIAAVIDAKQDKLTAGSNITITGNVIAAAKGMTDTEKSQLTAATTDITSIKQDVADYTVSKNLMGMEYDRYYRLVKPIPQGTQLYITRSDGSVFPTSNVERLYVYDENKAYVDYFSLKTGTASKTTSGMKKDIYYLRWNDPSNAGAYNVPMMVTTLANKCAYVPYFDNVRVLADTVDGIDSDVESLSGDVYGLICKNLMATMPNVMQPLDVSAGEYLTVTKSDKSVFATTSTQVLCLYDKDKTLKVTRTLNHGAAFETFSVASDCAYAMLLTDDSNLFTVSLMVTKGNNSSRPYVAYSDNLNRLKGEITPYYSRTDVVNAGVTYAWTGTACTVNGTASATSHDTLYKYTWEKPEIFKAGNKLYIHYHVTDAKIYLEIVSVKMNGSTVESSNAFVMRRPGWYTVPEDMDRISLYIRVSNGDEVHGTFSDFGIFSTYPKERIEASPCLPLLVTLTDDDTLTDEDVGHFHDCLMHNDVRGAYAFIGRRVEEAHTTTIAKLQAVEDDGFDVLPHCWTQQPYFENKTERNLASCIQNMQKVKRYMSQNNLNSQDEWIVPYGATDEGIRHVAKTLGFKMMFSSATKDFNRAIDTERYRVKRCGFHPTWTEQSNLQLDGIKAIFDKMVEYGGGWMIVCCHVKDWNKKNFPDNPEMWVDFDETLDANGYPVGYAALNAFISYCKSKGATFVNVREGHQWIEPYLQNS